MTDMSYPYQKFGCTNPKIAAYPFRCSKKEKKSKKKVFSKVGEPYG